MEATRAHAITSDMISEMFDQVLTSDKEPTRCLAQDLSFLFVGKDARIQRDF